jgi:hypothetical protein
MAGLSNGVSASESSVLKIRAVFVIYNHQRIVLKVYPSTCQVILVIDLYEQPEKGLDASKVDHRNKLVLGEKFVSSLTEHLHKDTFCALPFTKKIVGPPAAGLIRCSTWLCHPKFIFYKAKV